MNLTIYRGASTEIATIAIDEKTVLTRKLMNEDKIMSEFITEGVLPIEIGDWVSFNSKKYYLNQLPSIEKLKDNTFQYFATFQSELYDLYNKLLISIDGLNDFSQVGTAQDLLTLIVTNMNTISSGWTVGDVDESAQKSVDFINESCRTALTKIAELFGFEFNVVNKTINLKKAIGNVTAYTFKYGKNNGLYSIERRTVESRNVFTKVYGYGSTKNLPFTYRNRAKRLVFESKFLEKNVDIYGIKEGHYTNDDIYPERTGELTGVNIVFDAQNFDASASYVEDSTIDFDLVSLSGTNGKIVFKSGDLSGSEFEIYKFDSATKRIYFNPIGEADGYQSPNLDSKPNIGDEYTLVDIVMPITYIIDAELRLKEATQVFLDDNSVPKSLYLVKIDSKYAKANSIVLDAGDLVMINDAQLGVDRAIRISEVSFPIVNPNEITAVIADFIPYTLQQLVSKNAIVSSKAIKSVINQITNIQNVSNKSTTNIDNSTTVINAESGFIIINGRKFKWIKGFDNFDLANLEAGDTIQDNYWNRILYVKNWEFLGGGKEFVENWNQIESVEVVI